MANYCSNYVIITGEKEVIHKLKSLFDNYNKFDDMGSFGDSFFGGVTTERACASDLTDYGTKWWDFTATVEEYGDQAELTVSGDSAWAPPSHLLKKISEHYPVKIVLDYEEPGCDFAGTTVFENGVEDDECYKYMEYLFLKNKETFIEELISEFYDSSSNNDWNDYLTDLRNGWVSPSDFNIVPLLLADDVTVTADGMRAMIDGVLRDEDAPTIERDFYPDKLNEWFSFKVGEHCYDAHLDTTDEGNEGIVVYPVKDGQTDYNKVVARLCLKELAQGSDLLPNLIR